MLQGASTIAAIIMETIVGTNGVLVPPPGYLQGVRELCDRYGILWIADEVMVGFGRVGQWFAFQAFDVAPDLITFAKGVNSGYVPLGGVVISDRVAAHFDTVAFPGGLTYSGHPLACAAAVANISVLEEENIVEHAAELGEQVFGPKLAELAAKHPLVGEVRGTGVFWVAELVADQQTREPLSAADIGAVVAASKQRGLLPMANANRIHLVPPLTTTAEQVAEGIDILDQALTEVEAARS